MEGIFNNSYNKRFLRGVLLQVNVYFGIVTCVSRSMFKGSKQYYMRIDVSGGHLNPAISLMFYTMGKIPLSHVFYYSIAQTLGAFIGTALAYTVYIGLCFLFSHPITLENFLFTGTQKSGNQSIAVKRRRNLPAAWIINQKALTCCQVVDGSSYNCLKWCKLKTIWGPANRSSNTCQRIVEGMVFKFRTTDNCPGSNVKAALNDYITLTSPHEIFNCQE